MAIKVVLSMYLHALTMEEMKVHDVHMVKKTETLYTDPILVQCCIVLENSTRFKLWSLSAAPTMGEMKVHRHIITSTW